MIDSEDADRAVSALMMVIAGLAEDIIDRIASAQPEALDERLVQLGAIAASGTDIAAAAAVAASTLERSCDSRL